MRKLLLLSYSLFAMVSSLSANWVSVADKAKKSFVAINTISITEVETSSEGVTRLEFSESGGSGVFINREGLILTVAHLYWTDGKVISTTVMVPDGKVYPGRVIKISTSTDLALVQVDYESVPLKIAREGSVRTGQPVMLIGNPVGLLRSVTTGIVSAATRWYYGGYYVQFDAPCYYGSSGGALLNTRGQIIGIMSRVKINECGPISGFSFAVPVKEIRDFLKTYRRRPRLKDINER